jgi:excisionase family DNA binding protein
MRASIATEYVPPSYVQHRFGIRAATVRKWARERKLGSTKVGKLILVRLADVEALVSEGERPRAASV